MKMGSQQGFTLVEIMIVVSVIALLSVIAVPSMVRARETTQRTACISNLRQMSAAKDQWAIENFKSDFDPVVASEVSLYIKGGMPHCPANGIYMWMNVKMNPTCSTAFHML
jgi:prepilin-type N-terminal cleavage/methylation domain-containing protein